MFRLGRIGFLITLCFVVRPLAQTTEATGSRPSIKHHALLAACHLPDISFEVQCGTYGVYENRAARSGRKINLNIVRLPAATSQPAEPVFLLAGGPGGAATDAVGEANEDLFQALHKEHDLVFVDQRGTGKSNGLRCQIGVDPSHLNDFFGELFPPEAIRVCRNKLEKRADLRMYTTSIAMDDLDEVRQALGYGQINVVGGSYGSIAALVYVRQHSDSVRAVLLAGVATPAIKQPLLFARAAQHALDLLFVDCAADHDCKNAYPNLKREFYAILSRFDHGPIQVKMLNPKTKQMQTVRLERENYVERLRFLLYTAPSAAFLPLVVHKAYQEDFVPFETTSIIFSPGSGVALGMYFTVTCSEGVPFITGQDIVSEAKGTFLGEERVRSHIRACQEWVRGDVDKSFLAPIKANVPVLMMSGEIDGATPQWFGEEAVKSLPKGRQVEVRNAGHEISGPCITDIEQKFFRSASVSNIDTSCVEKIRRPPFATRMPADMVF